MSSRHLGADEPAEQAGWSFRAEVSGAGLALLEPQDQRILSLVALQLDEQIDSAARQGQLSTSAARQQAEGISNAIAEFRAGQQVDTVGVLPQIVPVSTISPLASALASGGTTGPGLKILAGVNHLLHQPGTADNDAVLAPAVLAALQAWARPYATAG